MRPDGAAVQIELTAGGLDPDLLARIQPDAAADPEFRLRRIRRLATDPLYMPIVASGQLAAVAEQPRHRS